jgi:hypothetical protein
MSWEERDVRSVPAQDVAPTAVAPPTAPPVPVVPPAAGNPVAPPSPERPAVPSGMPAAPPLTPPSTQTTSARVEWRLTVGAATVLALCAVLVFGAGVAVGQLALPASTTRSPASPSSSQGRPPTVSATTPAAAAPGSKTKTAERSYATTRSITAESSGPAPPTAPIPSGVLPIPTSTPAATEARERKSSPVPAHPARQPSNAVRPVPNSGYAFFDGSFQLSGDGRRIVRFTVRTSCAGPVVLRPIHVAPAGTFAFSGHPAGSLPGTDVRLTGRFVSRAEAQGTLRVTRATCHDTATPFVAHLS